MKTIGKIAGVVATIAMIGTGIGAALGVPMMLTLFGASISASAIAGAASLVSVGASMLTKPKAAKVSDANEDRLNASLNPRAPRVAAFGRTALATDLRDQEFTGPDKEYLHRFFVVAAHRVNSVEEIWFDDELAWTAAGGVTSKYSGYLQVTVRTEGAPGNAINISSRMGSSRRFTGLAYVYLRYKLTGNSKKTESPFAQQVPTRMTIVGEAMPCYDVRQDSTRGGSGSHRAEDQSTWTYGEHARNPACQLATWLLGWQIQNPQSLSWKLSVGQGIPAERIDWASFIDAANLCDEPVALAAGGAEPRYRGDGLFDEDDDPTFVVDSFKACMNADLDDQDGLLRLTVFHNDLATPDADFTEADIEDEYQWKQTQPLHESFNVVRGNYVEPDPKSLYQPAPYRDAEVASPDGIERVHPADFGLVQSRGQAERLAKQRLQRQLYGGTFAATFLASGWKVQKNSVVRLSFAPEGWTNKLFRVVETAVQQDGRVPMVLREEHADIYAWDAEESPAVQIADPTQYAPGDAPIPQFLGTIEEGATVGAVIPGPDGTGGNIKDLGGNPVFAGELLNSAVALVANGRTLRLEYTPVEGELPIVLAEVEAPDLGAAKASALGQASADLERLAAAIVQLQNEASRQREIVRDAGISVDPATGVVHLHAFDRSEERLNTVDVRLDAVDAEILLRATTTYVDNAIATAVLDPSQVPVFTELEARITTAEAEIDGLDAEVALRATVIDVNAIEARVSTAETDISALEGLVSTKVSTTTFDALETRVDVAESQLSAMDGATISDTVRAARLLANEADAQDANTLASLLAGDRAKREQVAGIAQARQELTAKIVDDVAAEASQRLSLAARVSAAEASLVSESTTRASQDSALASQISGLTASLDSEVSAREAAVASEASARVSGDNVLASQLTTLSTTVDGHSSSITAFAQSIDGLEARVGVRLDVNGRVTGWVLNDDGQQGAFAIRADSFSIEPTSSSGPRTAFADGVWRVFSDTHMVAFGVTSAGGFGTSNQFIMWYGPVPSAGNIANCAEADALFYLKKNGGLYFGGRSANDDYVRKDGRLAFSGTAFQQVGQSVTVFPTSSGSVALRAEGRVFALGGTPLIAYEYKWQYSPDKASWSDVAGSLVSDSLAGPGAEDTVSAATKSGLTADLPAYFRVVARKSTAGSDGAMEISAEYSAQST